VKRLQESRVCHVQTCLASAERHVLQKNLCIFAGERSGDRGAQPVMGVMERALNHKFPLGATVHFTASNVSRPAATGTYEIIRLLPTDGDDCQYRIKSSIEAFERVAKESQLAMS
jgi:hypothetical protein